MYYPNDPIERWLSEIKCIKNMPQRYNLFSRIQTKQAKNKHFQTKKSVILMHFQTKISQITMYFQSKNTKNDAFSKYILSYTKLALL